MTEAGLALERRQPGTLKLTELINSHIFRAPEAQFAGLCGLGVEP